MRASRALSHQSGLTDRTCSCLTAPARCAQGTAAGGRHAGDAAQPPWAQVAISTTGVIRLTVDRGTYIVPPSRALWFHRAWSTP